MFGDNAHKYYCATLCGNDKLLDKLCECEISPEGRGAYLGEVSYDCPKGGADCY